MTILFDLCKRAQCRSNCQQASMITRSMTNKLNAIKKVYLKEKQNGYRVLPKWSDLLDEQTEDTDIKKEPEFVGPPSPGYYVKKFVVGNEENSGENSNENLSESKEYISSGRNKILMVLERKRREIVDFVDLTEEFIDLTNEEVEEEGGIEQMMRAIFGDEIHLENLKIDIKTEDNTENKEKKREELVKINTFNDITIEKEERNLSKKLQSEKILQKEKHQIKHIASKTSKKIVKKDKPKTRKITRKKRFQNQRIKFCKLFFKKNSQRLVKFKKNIKKQPIKNKNPKIHSEKYKSFCDYSFSFCCGHSLKDANRCLTCNIDNILVDIIAKKCEISSWKKQFTCVIQDMKARFEASVSRCYPYIIGNYKAFLRRTYTKNCETFPKFNLEMIKCVASFEGKDSAERCTEETMQKQHANDEKNIGNKTKEPVSQIMKHYKKQIIQKHEKPDNSIEKTLGNEKENSAEETENSEENDNHSNSSNSNDKICIKPKRKKTSRQHFRHASMELYKLGQNDNPTSLCKTKPPFKLNVDKNLTSNPDVFNCTKEQLTENIVSSLKGKQIENTNENLSGRHILPPIINEHLGRRKSLTKSIQLSNKDSISTLTKSPISTPEEREEVEPKKVTNTSNTAVVQHITLGATTTGKENNESSVIDSVNKEAVLNMSLTTKHVQTKPSVSPKVSSQSINGNIHQRTLELPPRIKINTMALENRHHPMRRQTIDQMPSTSLPNQNQCFRISPDQFVNRHIENGNRPMYYFDQPSQNSAYPYMTNIPMHNNMLIPRLNLTSSNMYNFYPPTPERSPTIPPTFLTQPQKQNGRKFIDQNIIDIHEKPVKRPRGRPRIHPPKTQTKKTYVQPIPNNTYFDKSANFVQQTATSNLMQKAPLINFRQQTSTTKVAQHTAPVTTFAKTAYPPADSDIYTQKHMMEKYLSPPPTPVTPTAPCKARIETDPLNLSVRHTREAFFEKPKAVTREIHSQINGTSQNKCMEQNNSKDNSLSLYERIIAPDKHFQIKEPFEEIIPDIKKIITKNITLLKGETVDEKNVGLLVFILQNCFSDQISQSHFQHLALLYRKLTKYSYPEVNKQLYQLIINTKFEIIESVKDTIAKDTEDPMKNILAECDNKLLDAFTETTLLVGTSVNLYEQKLEALIKTKIAKNELSEKYIDKNGNILMDMESKEMLIDIFRHWLVLTKASRKIKNSKTNDEPVLNNKNKDSKNYERQETVVIEDKEVSISLVENGEKLKELAESAEAVFNLKKDLNDEVKIKYETPNGDIEGLKHTLLKAKTKDKQQIINFLQKDIELTGDVVVIDDDDEEHSPELNGLTGQIRGVKRKLEQTSNSLSEKYLSVDVHSSDSHCSIEISCSDSNKTGKITNHFVEDISDDSDIVTLHHPDNSVSPFETRMKIVKEKLIDVSASKFQPHKLDFLYGENECVPIKEGAAFIEAHYNKNPKDYRRQISYGEESTESNIDYLKRIPKGKLCYIKEKHIFIRYFDETQIEMFVENLKQSDKDYVPNDLYKQCYKDGVKPQSYTELQNQKCQTEIINIPKNVTFSTQDALSNPEEYVAEYNKVQSNVPEDFFYYYKFVTGYQIYKGNFPISFHTFLAMHNTNGLKTLYSRYISQLKENVGDESVT